MDDRPCMCMHTTTKTDAQVFLSVFKFVINLMRESYAAQKDLRIQNVKGTDGHYERGRGRERWKCVFR